MAEERNSDISAAVKKATLAEAYLFGSGEKAYSSTGSDVIAYGRETLAAIDSAAIGTVHIRAVVVADTGFFTDAYDLFSANFITSLIGLSFYDTHIIPTQADTAIKISTTAGAISAKCSLVGLLTSSAANACMALN